MASRCSMRVLALRRTPAVASRAAAFVAPQVRRASWQSARREIPVERVCVSGGVYEQRRWNSGVVEQKGSKIYEFDDLIKILETPSSSRLLIDVREPHEYNQNTIPTAINIPVTSHPDALLLDDATFLERFHFAKPPLNKEIVFFCKAGVRSRAAAALARQAGYQNVGEYPGSWLDWEKRGGPGTKSPPAPGGKGEPKLGVSEMRPSEKWESGEEDLGPQGGIKYADGGLTKGRQ